jgi:hypothetical protein
MFILPYRQVNILRGFDDSSYVGGVFANELLYVLLNGERAVEGVKIFKWPGPKVGSLRTWSISSEFHFYFQTWIRIECSEGNFDSCINQIKVLVVIRWHLETRFCRKHRLFSKSLGDKQFSIYILYRFHEVLQPNCFLVKQKSNFIQKVILRLFRRNQPQQLLRYWICNRNQ